MFKQLISLAAMRKLLFTILSFFTYTINLYPQYYVEQNSGVTNYLTSVSINQYQYFNVWVCGYGGTVLKTTNSGINWINVSGNGIPNTVDLVNIFCIDTSSALTAGFNSSNTYVYRTSNGGANWQQVFAQLNGFINAIWIKPSLQGFMFGDPVGNRWSLWKTTNGGFNWDSTGMYLPQTLGTEAGWNNALYILNNRILFGTNSSRIYASPNFGTNWIAIPTAWVNTTAIWYYWGDSLYGYIGSNNSYKTTNGGLIWTLMTCPGSGNFAGFCSGVMGVNYDKSPPLLSWTVRNDNKIYRNFNMSDWNTDYTAPSGNYTHIAPDILNFTYYSWAVRSNGGITRIQTAFVGINQVSSEIPERFCLYQNYPNPFNPITKIKFDIPSGVKSETSNIKVVVYSILGQEIATLVNEPLKPGTYEVEWEGTHCPSGVYFYKLIFGDFILTRKMILIK